MTYREFDGEALREAVATRTGTMVTRLCYADVPLGAWVDADGRVNVRYGAALYEERVASTVANAFVGKNSRRLFEIAPGRDIDAVLDELVKHAMRAGPRMNYMAVRLGLSSP